MLDQAERTDFATNKFRGRLCGDISTDRKHFKFEILNYMINRTTLKRLSSRTGRTKYKSQ